MHADRDLDVDAELPADAPTVGRDLGLDAVVGAMAQGDEFLRSTARYAVAASLTDPDEIAYRQHVLRDCLDQPHVVRALYDIATDAAGVERLVFVGVPQTTFSPQTGKRRGAFDRGAPPDDKRLIFCQ